MNAQFSAVSRVTSLIAGVIATAITLLAPIGYFYVSRNSVLSNIKTDNELTANAITGIVTANPKTWPFQDLRISEILARRARPNTFESRQVLDSKGLVVAESIGDVPWPTISDSHDIYDAGTVVARIELIRSLQPIAIRTLIIAAVSLTLGLLVFIILRIIPMRAVRRAYGQLSQNELRYRSLYNSMREGLGLFEPVYGADKTIKDFLFLDVNPALEHILGAEKNALVGTSGAHLLNGALLNYCTDIASAMNHATTLHIEATDQDAKKYYDVNLFAPTSTTFAILIEDITDRKISEKQIHTLAYYDQLTELPNRFLLIDRLEQLLAQCRRDNKGVALLFLDLDRFKHINDTLGHALGDQLLIAVAKRLSKGLRKSDSIARLGGDEFVVLISFSDEGAGITHLAKKLINAIAKPFIIADHKVFSGTSIGIATFPSDGCDSETLLKNADLAMYAAKEMGRSSYCFFTAEMNSKAHVRMEMDAKMRYALTHDEFFLVFQPVMNITTNTMTSAECLIRWRDTSGKLIMPGDFIPLAEESGLIIAIGEWVIKEACHALKTWSEADLPPVKISINVSARQFSQHNFLDFLISVIDSTNIDTHFLELELTESSLMNDPHLVTETLDQFKAKGLSLAIDDFGTGYSSLSYLSRFPIDRLKIDRSFIRELITNTTDQAIVEAIFAMADKLEIEVVVEGVETADQVAFLQPLGCHYIQGYYFHRPLEEEAFLKLLTR
ncbi:MAG: EAL domain-containing protein [Proteobacteria bacterium]|nr:EAL domain-containing protein [Desulfobulbaceae bacterium]MBU4153100.1 EAL domain-containing protein [Pseudomonadota bacterium]